MEGQSGTGRIPAALIVSAALLVGALLVRGALERQTAAIEDVQTVLGDVGKALASGRPSAPSRADAGAPDPGARYTVKTDGAPVRGPDDAKVTLDQIRKTYGDRVRVVFKHLPLKSIHPQAGPAATAAEAAHGQGKFWEMHDLIFANQGQLGDAKYQEWARQLGLDMDRFDKDLKSPAVSQRIDADSQEAAKLGVSGTPAFFVNGRYLSGAQPFERFKALIDEELAKAKG